MTKCESGVGTCNESWVKECRNEVKEWDEGGGESIESMGVCVKVG